MLRYFLLRFLPRRLLPLITLYEAYRLFRRWQASRVPRPPRRLVVSGPAEPGVITTMTPTPVDGQLHGG